MLIIIGEHQRRHAALNNVDGPCRFYKIRLDSIHCGPDVVHNQYLDLTLVVLAN